MKAIKLITIFVVLIGAIVLVMKLPSIFKPATGGNKGFGNKNLIDISAKCKEIRNAWEKSAGWDESLYKALRDDIDQSKAMGMFSREGYNTVNNTLRETSTNKACNGYLDVLHSKDFSETTLKAQYAGVCFLKKHENLSSDNRIKDVESRQSLYMKIDRFVSSNHPITPHFNNQTTEWTSFSMLQSRILNEARALRQNAIYSKEMSHIKKFSSGLSESELKSKTNKQRPAFYRGLCRQIINYFQNEEPTQDKKNLLNQIYRNFGYQESNYGLEELANFKVNYGD